MYFILLCGGLHHREMIQRKSLNYERVLNVEIKKTNELIINLIPGHLLNVIINEKRQVDEFEDMTLLVFDIPQFTEFNKDVIKILSKIFIRFDQLTIDNKVYKVQTLGDQYIVMGYSGRVDKESRTKAIIYDEAIRVVLTGLQMVDSVKEILKQSSNKDFAHLSVRVGIHSGKIIAGFIGSKVIKYDIFGENVLVANKTKSNAAKNKVTISSATRSLLETSSRALKMWTFQFHGDIRVKEIAKVYQLHTVEIREDSLVTDSGGYGEQSEDSIDSLELQS